MQYKNKAKHINIRDGFCCSLKIRPNIERKKVIYYVAAGLSVKSCSNLLESKYKNDFNTKRSTYKKMDITTDVELIHLMLNEFYISVDIT